LAKHAAEQIVNGDALAPRLAARQPCPTPDGASEHASRPGNVVDDEYPQLDAPDAGQPEINGELVIYRYGRLDFAARQRRIHPSAIHTARRAALTPATLVVFDIVASAGVDLRGRPDCARREHLEQLLDLQKIP
jgi:ATP-dependent DNA ligase